MEKMELPAFQALQLPYQRQRTEPGFLFLKSPAPQEERLTWEWDPWELDPESRGST